MIFAIDRIRHIESFADQEGQAAERSALLTALEEVHARLLQATELCEGQEKEICITETDKAIKAIPAVPQKFLEVN